MLLKLASNLQIQNIHVNPYVGFVVENNDPKKLGRIKCNIPGRWEESDTSKLPWVYPLVPAGMGGRPDLSTFTVPDKISQVIITFPFQDEYSPFYIGRWVTDGTYSPIFDEDYPNSYGFIDPNQWVRVNKSKFYTEFFTKIENLFRIDEEGTVWINIPKDLVVKIKGNCLIDIEKSKVIKVEKDCSLKVNGKHQSDVSGNYAIKSGGVIDAKASGNLGLVAGGIMSLEGITINKNSGILFGVADEGASAVSSNVGDLGGKISELTSKINELKELYSQVQNAVNKSREVLK